MNFFFINGLLSTPLFRRATYRSCTKAVDSIIGSYQDNKGMSYNFDQFGILTYSLEGEMKRVSRWSIIGDNGDYYTVLITKGEYNTELGDEYYFNPKLNQFLTKDLKLAFFSRAGYAPSATHRPCLNSDDCKPDFLFQCAGTCQARKAFVECDLN